MNEEEWIRLTPDDECLPMEGAMFYSLHRGIGPDLRRHWLRYESPIGEDELEWWNLSTAELAAIPPVKALIEAAREVEAVAFAQLGWPTLEQLLKSIRKLAAALAVFAEDADE